MVNDIQVSATTLSNDLVVISNSVFQWKMILNPDLTEQTQQIIFSRKTKKLLTPTLSFSSIPLKNCMFQKHLRLTLDKKTKFFRTHKKYHLKN